MTGESAWPPDYAERVYAGVLGKIIAVYLGRPIEGWTYQRIHRELGDISAFVHDSPAVGMLDPLLVVTDDDISGTFIFPRVLAHSRVPGRPTPAEVGVEWLNQIIEERTALWWGGLGNSTEHTAYLRLRAGVPAPMSGSAELNGAVAAEQVGGQIFVEGLAMTCPGDPEAAAQLARTSASVSHDGEALHAAQVVAALVAGAFVETDMARLLDTASALVPATSLVRRVIHDVRTWQAEDGDWRRTRARIEATYGYDRYGGNCHVVPNHAVVIAALAHSGGQFDEAMRIVQTSGWDTDSNGGNVGAICGVFGGLAGIDLRWREPVADRMYLPAADAGSVVTDAAREAVKLVDLARHREGEAPLAPKGGARFPFWLPGAVHGFGSQRASVRNIAGALAIEDLSQVPERIVTPTFIPPQARNMPHYELVASPTLYPGQVLHARAQVPPSAHEAVVALCLGSYDERDEISWTAGPASRIPPGEALDLRWTVPDLDGQPVTFAGLQASGSWLNLHYLTWDGEPRVRFSQPAAGGTMWRRAWVDAVDRYDPDWDEPFRIVQNRGRGMLIQGAPEWCDYRVSADLTPHVARSVGLAARVQGLNRYYAVELADRQQVRLVRWRGAPTVLATTDLCWEFGTTYRLSLSVVADRVSADLDGREIFAVRDPGGINGGAVALLIEEGRSVTQEVLVQGTPSGAGG